MIDWPKVAKKVNSLYSSPEGRPAYPLVTMVKIIVLQQWHHASDAAIEEAVSDRLSFRRFAGLTLQDAVPDHSTISRFRKEVAERGLARRLFAEVNRQLEGKGLLVKKGTLIDASVIEAQARRFLPPVPNRPEGAWWPKHHIDNDFNVDWRRQKDVQFSGLPGTWVQDSGMQETMGRVANRGIEHLGVSDTGIIRTRRALIKAARLLRDYGIEPDSVWDSGVYSTRSAAVVLPRDAEWVEASAEYRETNPSVNFAAV